VNITKNHLLVYKIAFVAFIDLKINQTPVKQ